MLANDVRQPSWAKTRSALAELVAVAPDVAVVMRVGEQVDVPAAGVVAGESSPVEKSTGPRRLPASPPLPSTSQGRPPIRDTTRRRNAMSSTERYTVADAAWAHPDSRRVLRTGKHAQITINMTIPVSGKIGEEDDETSDQTLSFVSGAGEAGLPTIPTMSAPETSARWRPAPGTGSAIPGTCRSLSTQPAPHLSTPQVQSTPPRSGPTPPRRTAKTSPPPADPAGTRPCTGKEGQP